MSLDRSASPPPEPSSPQRVDALLRQVRALAADGQIVAAAAFACERLRESQSALSPPQEATLALLEGMAQLITGKGGHLPGMVDEYDRTLDALEQALKLARAANAVHAETGCLNSLAFVWLDRARVSTSTPEAQQASAAQALAHADRALAIATTVAAIRACVWARNSRTRALILLGELPTAEAELQQTVEAAAGFPQLHAELLHTAACLELAHGDFERARLHVDEGLAQARAQSSEQLFGRLLEERVRIERMAGRTQEAQAWFERRVAHMDAQSRQRLQTSVPTIARAAG
jgi:tetratricopeptide (TPR) repeat protein